MVVQINVYYHCRRIQRKLDTSVVRLNLRIRTQQGTNENFIRDFWSGELGKRVSG